MNKLFTLFFALITGSLAVLGQTPCPDGLSANAGPNAVFCSGGSATLGYMPAATGGHSPYSYVWRPAAGLSSASAANPVTYVANTTTYTLQVTDSLGCTSTSSTVVTVNYPPDQPICLVTADSADDAEIVVWEKVNRNATDSFFIYREITTNDYEKVGAVPGDSLSQFTDYGANPQITSYRYKMTALDTCGNESPMSPYHNSIHLVYQAGGQLSWNPYQIQDDTTTPVSSFVVMKDSLGNGNWEVFVTVPGDQYSVTDIYYASNPNAQYRISANFSYVCTPTRSYVAVLSNIVSQTLTAVQNITDERFTIYPNPASGLLNIGYTGTQPEWINIYNVNGQVVSSQKYTSPVINVANYMPGIYFIELRTNNGVARMKFVKI
jgi:hypothetical protein